MFRFWKINNAISTPINQNWNPYEWHNHHFGIPLDRWNALKGKYIWITGAGTGYGRSLAISLAAAGSFVILSGRRRHKLIETIELMKSYGISGNNCEVIEFDIRDMKETEEACRKVSVITPYIYGLINNAAVPQYGNFKFPLQEASFELWDNILRTNLTAQWYLTKTILPCMVKGEKVRVIFISSEAGWASTTGFGVYNVSKSALNSLSASFASELSFSYKDRGIDIQVNALVPGEARTEMNQGSDVSPFTMVPMTLALLSHKAGGPNGKFFHMDGRHLSFAYSKSYDKSLI